MMFIGFGVLAIVVARDYPMGSAMRMGPGYFPTWIGACLIIVGALIAAFSFRTQGEGIGRWPWKAIVLLSVAFAAFAWGIDNFGFVLALVILIVLSALAGREYKWWEIAAEAVVLIVGCWAIFIYGLELPFPLWGGR
jgi:hypothetical protein